MKLKINYLKFKKGISLIELLIVLPIISIILLITYNMFFLTNKSFNYVKENFNIGEDIRTFTSTIQKEANQAKKANDNTVLYKPNGSKKELYIYTDIDGDDIPELVRYRVLDDNIIKDIKKATNNKFPYEYKSSFTNEKIVLSNINIGEDGIFKDIERVEKKNEYIDENDNRRMVKMIIEINTGKDSTPIVINTILITKSRVGFDN